MRRALIAAVFVSVFGSALTACSNEPEHPVESFCSTYRSEKAAYIQKYNAKTSQLQQSSDPLATVFGGFATSFQALGDIERIFEKLAKVAPDDIQPSVEVVRDSLKRTEDQVAGQNPLSGSSILTSLLGGLENSLESSGAWQEVGNYVETNCHTT